MAPASTKQWACLVCKENIKKSECSVPCQVCEEYTHPKCSKMSNDLVQYLLDETNDGNDISWTCVPCKKVGKYLNNKVKVVARKLEELEKRMTTMQEDHDKMKKDVEKNRDKGDNYVEQVKKVTAEVKKSIFTELRERKEKESNVLFHGVPEMDDANATGFDKKKYDMEWIVDIAGEMKVKMKEEDLKFCRRLGEKKSDKVRPILVGLRSVQSKMECIKNGKMLNECGEDSDFFGIYVVPDLTKQQREEEDEMARQVLKLNSELEPDVALNSEWRLVGMKGEKRMVLGKKMESPWERAGSRSRRGRGGVTRGRGTVRGQRGRGVGLRGAARGASRGTRNSSSSRVETEEA